MKKWIIIGILLLLLIGIFPLLYFLDNQLVEQYASSNLNEGKPENKINLETEGEKVRNLKSDYVQETIPIQLKVNSQTIKAVLYNNETTQELIKQFPITFEMKDLNSNEKYYYMNSKLKTNATTPEKIQAGDIKLYGDNCFVIFYQNFQNPGYRYTDLGYIEEIDKLISETKKQELTISIDIVE